MSCENNEHPEVLRFRHYELLQSEMQEWGREGWRL